MNEPLKQFVPDNVTVEQLPNAVVFEVLATNIIAVAGDLRFNKKLVLKFITATDERAENGCYKIWYVFGAPEQHGFVIPFITLKNTEEFPSLTPTIHEAWNMERKVKSMFGLTPVGHPDLRQIVLHENWPVTMFPLRKDFEWNTRPKMASGSYPFQVVAGEGIYEIPVGPIHAGIIEPGHFRFSMAGEEIMLLEPRLGWTHKGTEKLFETLPMHEKIRLSERISGDSSFSHSMAFCQAVEQLADITVPDRAKYLRVVFAELERLANHAGDIGAIMIDTGFNFGGGQGARLREVVMRIHERLSGNRFLRGVNVIGGVTKDIPETQLTRLKVDLSAWEKDFSEVIAIAESSTTLLNRLKGTGILPLEIAQTHGVLGVAARAAGVVADTRVDYPYAGYGLLPAVEIASETDGDVYARFQVRIKEVASTIKLIKRALTQLPPGPLAAVVETLVLKKNGTALSVVEGWRGEIMYLVTTDKQGTIARVAPRDPSFLNWHAVGNAGPGNIVPDFPLINKSFNLSYTGYDL